jgi:hypothetical protein
MSTKGQEGCRNQYSVQSPHWLTAQTILAASHWCLKQEKDAREMCETITKQHPKYSVDRWSKGFSYRDPEHLAALMDPLLEAGLNQYPF